MSKRYIVTVTDTEGVVWLNTGSFEVKGGTVFREQFIQYLQELIEIFKTKAKPETCNLCGVYYSSYRHGVHVMNQKACPHAD